MPVNCYENLLASGKAAEITISGGNNNLVAHADSVENNTTVMLNNPGARRGKNRERIIFNTDFYHVWADSKSAAAPEKPMIAM